MTNKLSTGKAIVFIETRTESTSIRDFDTVAEAKAYVDAKVKDEEFAGIGEPSDDIAPYFRYAIYLEESFDEDNGFGDPIYVTPYYWDNE